MDNVLFVPSTPDTEWLQEILPGTSPAALPVAGRRAIDYMMEAARRRDIVFIEILDWHYSPAVASSFSEPTTTGFPVFYMKGEGAMPRGLAEIENLSTPLTQSLQDGLVVAWGVFAVDAPVALESEPVPEAECVSTPPGIYRREGGRWARVSAEIMPVCDIATWHAANMRVLHSPGKLTLPGYSAEKGVHIGRNVVLERGVDASAPVLLCDDAWCARNAILGGDVIVGERSYVGEGTKLARTVVGDDTQIGDGLVFEDKIIVGSRVIDAQTGVWTDVEDPGVARPVGKAARRSGPLRRAMNFLFGWARGRMA